MSDNENKSLGKIQSNGKRPPLTLNEKKFVKLYLECGNATEAYMAAYGMDNRRSASVLGSRLLGKVDFTDLLDAAGLTDEAMAKGLFEGTQANRTISARIIIKPDDPTAKVEKANSVTMDFVDVPDWAVRAKFWEMVLKLKNKFPAARFEAALGGQEMIERWKEQLGISDENINSDSFFDVDLDDVSEGALPLPEGDSSTNT